MWVLFALNRLSYRLFWWHSSIFKKREKKWVSSRWNSLGTITNSLWVLELNSYETMKWNSPLIMGVSFKFHFISYDVAVLETRPWHSPRQSQWRVSWCCFQDCHVMWNEIKLGWNTHSQWRVSFHSFMGI